MFVASDSGQTPIHCHVLSRSQPTDWSGWSSSTPVSRPELGVVSLGFFLLVINAAIILIASNILHAGFKVDGFWVAFLFSILISITNSILERISKRLEERQNNTY